jgi:hypothetical protein
VKRRKKETVSSPLKYIVVGRDHDFEKKRKKLIKEKKIYSLLRKEGLSGVNSRLVILKKDLMEDEV